jgi:hypothetical protein
MEVFMGSDKELNDMRTSGMAKADQMVSAGIEWMLMQNIINRSFVEAMRDIILCDDAPGLREFSDEEIVNVLQFAKIGYATVLSGLTDRILELNKED